MAGKEDIINFETEDTQEGRFLTFSLGRESYGIEIRYVTEIIGIQPITEIPELPEYKAERAPVWAAPLEDKFTG